MASKAYPQSRPIDFDNDMSSRNMYYMPISPSEPGKFDFYRVYLANHRSESDSTFPDNVDAPNLSTTTPSQTRWTPFANLSSTERIESSSKTNSIGNVQSIRSNETNQMQGATKTTLTEQVKTALDQGQLTVNSNQSKRIFGGTSLSSKDLNHLSPQSMWFEQMFYLFLSRRSIKSVRWTMFIFDWIRLDFVRWKVSNWTSLVFCLSLLFSLFSCCS